MYKGLPKFLFHYNKINLSDHRHLFSVHLCFRWARKVQRTLMMARKMLAQSGGDALATTLHFARYLTRSYLQVMLAANSLDCAPGCPNPIPLLRTLYKVPYSYPPSPFGHRWNLCILHLFIFAFINKLRCERVVAVVINIPAHSATNETRMGTYIYI